MQRQAASSAGDPRFGSFGALTPAVASVIPAGVQGLFGIGQAIGEEYARDPVGGWMKTGGALLANPLIQAKVINTITGRMLPAPMRTTKFDSAMQRMRR